MGERQTAGGFRFSCARDRLSLPDPEEAKKPAFDLGIEPRVVVADGQGDLLSRGDIDVDERPGDPQVTQPAPQVAVAQKLLTVTLERAPRQPKALRRETGRLELRDQP